MAIAAQSYSKEADSRDLNYEEIYYLEEAIGRLSEIIKSGKRSIKRHT
jgi:hypothetical protein